METQIPIFVLSSGRTGSTLLAKLIHRHPRLLCVSDLFEPVGDVPYFDRGRLVGGRELFEVLSAPSFPQRIRYWREQPTSELLFLPEDDDLVSLLLSYTLPFVTGDKDPMPLFREAKAAVEAFDEAPMADQMIRFFDWLRDHFGMDLWVERTGGSLPHTRKILETWPHAKVVHNYRDSRETALSMMTGSFFRLYLELEKNPELGEWDSSHMPPVAEMGAMLNRWLVDAVAAIEELPRERRIHLAFEQLIADPVGTLLRFSNFVFDRQEPTPEDVAWAVREAEIIRRPGRRFPKLEPREQGKLQEACAESLELLGYPMD